MKIKTYLILFLIVGILIFIKMKFLPGNLTAPPASPGMKQKVMVSARVVRPEKLENRIFSTGTVLASEEVDLKAEVSGRIVQILFKEGSPVGKGDLLLKINDSELQAQLKKNILELKLSEEKESRQKKLLALGAVSQEEYDISLNLKNTLEAEKELIISQISKTEVRAPFSGIIGLKEVSEGSLLSPSVKIASIQQMDPVKIDFSLPGKYSSLVNKGDSVRFTIQGMSGKFTGVIYAIEPKVETATRSIRLRALCPNPGNKIFPGSFAGIEVSINKSENGILIPTEALIPELKGQKVFLYRSGKAMPQKVETGTRTELNIEISEGLSAGDTVITSGIMQLKPGTDVSIMELK